MDIRGFHRFATVALGTSCWDYVCSLSRSLAYLTSVHTCRSESTKQSNWIRFLKCTMAENAPTWSDMRYQRVVFGALVPSHGRPTFSTRAVFAKFCLDEVSSAASSARTRNTGVMSLPGLGEIGDDRGRIYESWTTKMQIVAGFSTGGDIHPFLLIFAPMDFPDLISFLTVCAVAIYSILAW